MADQADKEFFEAFNNFDKAFFQLFSKSCNSLEHDETISAEGAHIITDNFPTIVKSWRHIQRLIWVIEKIYKNKETNEAYRKLKTDDERDDFLDECMLRSPWHQKSDE